eukprot:CAMPEP_0169112960 /NCGR_PEP_ID=MMETSP1015-20121227/27930_1 /TAXON_ID=342587 /ORGANISM="Karlodinium micrum, Strain CCMP2283" /LENGTH=243 /DNA_ID=CAMNT_0009175065 /DNA_START=86 /DNA_END=818 /DNA_ORIENTATION=-
MAYGPLCQCAFMSYGPRIQQKAPAKYEDRILYDRLPSFEAPQGSEAPPPGAFTLYAVDTSEAKADPNYNVRYMPLDESKCVVFGSSRDVDGLVYDGNKGVLGEHAALFYAKGKWFIKSVNGNTYIDSMTLHPYLRDSDGRAPRRFSADGGKKTVMLTPVDPKKRLTRERCVFRMADSDRIFWLVGPLALGDGEVELEGKTGEARRGRDDDRKGKRREKETRRERRDRTPSRSPTEAGAASAAS